MDNKERDRLYRRQADLAKQVAAAEARWHELQNKLDAARFEYDDLQAENAALRELARVLMLGIDRAAHGSQPTMDALAVLANRARALGVEAD